MYKSNSPQPACPASRRQGFALLITIVLMAFLVLIMVSFASLTRVEIQIASNYQQQDAARQNALTALQIALGQLQAAAGPDQRITARAEILDSTPATSPLTGVKQPHWTGVWTTGNANPDVTNGPTDPKQRQITFGSLSPTLAEKASNATAWLVSNPLPSTPVNPLDDTFTVSDTFTGADLIAANQSGVTTTAAEATPTAVVLAKNIGRLDPASPRHDTAADSTNPGFIVAAKLVGLTAPANSVPGFGAAATPTIGRYAYWVSDEGVKAKVNIKDPTLKTDSTGTTQVDAVTNLAQNLLHFGTPQATAAHKIWTDTTTGSAINTLASDFRMAADFRQNPKVDQVLTPQSLPLLPSAPPSGYVSNRYLADVTTYSYGVLADVRNGGLRKDLTAALEDTGGTPNTNFAKLAGANQRVYDIFNDAIPLATQLATTAGTPSSTIDNTNRGLAWNSLHYYYNLYKSTQPLLSASVYGPGQLRPTGVGNPAAATRPYGISASTSSLRQTNQNPLYNDYVTGQLSPICISMRWDVVLESRPQGSNYNLFLRYIPQSVWYNPYSVKITSTQKYLNTTFSPMPNALLTVTYPNGGSTVKSYCMLNQADANQRISYTNNLADSVSFEPGEIRVFGLNNSPTDIPATSTLGYSGSITTNSGVNIQTASGFITTELASQGYDPNYFCRTQYTGTLNSNGKTGLYTPIPNLPGGTLISLSLSNFAKPAQVFSKGPDSLNYWPNSTAVNRTRAGYVPSPTHLGTALPTSSTTLTKSNIPISTLTTPQLLLTFNTRKKGLKSFSSVTYINSNMDIPSFMGNSDGFNPINTAWSQSWNEFYIPSNSGSWPTSYSVPDEPNLPPVPAGNSPSTTWGDQSTGAEPIFGQSHRKILADVPLQPMLSLGQFMHLQTWQQVHIYDYQQLGFGSMFVGGSYPNPSVPLNTTLLDVSNTAVGLNPISQQKHYSVDHSFLANEKLFDSYYFSTVPPASLPTSPASPTNWTQFNNQNTGTQLTNTSTPFLNSRMVPYRKNGVAPALAELRDMDRAAANLLINGAFNINSTSVDAWRTLLSSLSGNDLNLWNATTRTGYTFTAAELKNPIPRFWSASGNAAVNTAWCGVRALSDTEITELATRIVAEVKIRGPFLSLSDFLNRRLGVSGTPLTRGGTLQAAIDKTTPNINAPIIASGNPVNVSQVLGGGAANCPLPLPIADNMKDVNGTPWNTTVGMPGYLMQQDLVQAFSPVMAARSDTFVIRTYGEKTDPLTNKPIAKAYCEAVVQRVPDYVDPNDPALTLGDATPVYQPNGVTPIVNITNQTFGRRFKVISFRWLSPNDL